MIQKLEFQSKKVVIPALIVAAACVGYLAHRVISPAVPKVHEHYVSMGAKAADIVAGQLPAGSTVLVLSPPPELYPLVNRQADEFRKRAPKAGLKVVGHEIARRRPRVDPYLYDIGVDPEEYLAYLAQYPDVNSVVSFSGVPIWNAQFPRGKAAHPPLVVISTRAEGLAALIRKGDVLLAIAPRSTDASTGDLEANGAADWFHSHYEVYSLAHVQTLSDGPTGLPHRR
jgi:hypothetical protein